MNEHKPEQMAASLQRAVQQVIAKGLQDPRVSGLITVTSVKVTSDLAEAFIHVSIYPEEKEKLTLHGLESAKSFIRRAAGDLVRSRSLPAFFFKLDRSLKKQAKILQEINRAMEETKDRSFSSSPPGSDALPNPPEHDLPTATPPAASPHPDEPR